MSIVFMDSVAHYSNVLDMMSRWSDVDSGNSSGYVSLASNARGGRRSFAISSYAGVVSYRLGHSTTVGTPGTEIYCGFDFFLDKTTLLVDEGYSFFGMTNSGGNLTTNVRLSTTLSLAVMSDGALALYSGTTQRAISDVGLIQPQTVHRIEMLASQNDAGSAKVWIDGLLAIDFAGDTYAGGGTADIKIIKFSGQRAAGDDVRFNFGNVVICDSAVGVGPEPADFPLGLVVVDALPADDAALDDTIPDGDDSFVSISAAGMNTYDVADLAGTPTILAAQAYATVRADGIASRRFELSVGATAQEFTAPGAPIYVTRIMPVDLADAAAVNAAQIGIELTDL